MSGSGLNAMINLGAWLGNEFGMEAISCGRGATAHEDCVLETCGKWLLFRIALRSNEVYLAASTLDDTAPAQTLLRATDTAVGWDTVRRLIAAMETHEVRDLKRPIEVGDPVVNDPNNCWVIG
jgi:hypothetical protein